jgi:hypothetical protein
MEMERSATFAKLRITFREIVLPTKGLHRPFAIGKCIRFLRINGNANVVHQSG